MAGAGYTLFVAGQVLTAAQVNTYLEQQTTMVFASAAAGDTALSAVKSEGMRRYLLDVNCEQVYSGSAWSTIGPVHGAPTAWAPAITQSGAVSCTVQTTECVYMRVGRMISAWFYLIVSGTGTAANIVNMSLPVTSGSGSPQLVAGTGFIVDSSAGNAKYMAMPVMSSTTAVSFLDMNGTGGYLGASGFTAALAVNDLIAGRIDYFAAGDA